MAKTKVELQNYQGESLSPITIASNVLYEDGRNAQEVFEEYSNETFTPTIENSSSMFKVGQGDSVDYSDNIVNGAYESMVLKGKSMVNCIQEPSSEDIVLPYEFEDGQYVTINDTKESGALGVELKGQTLVNLAKVRTATAYNRCSEKNIAIKPNTKYIALFNPTYYEAENGVNYALLLVSSVSLNDSVVGGDDAYTKSVSEGRGSEYKPRKGDRHLIFTSKANETYLHIRTGGNNGILYTDMIVLEYQEGMEDWDIPYFTGMTSCKMPILHTVGKNLFDVKKAIPQVNLTIGENYLEYYRENGSAHARFDVPVSGFEIGKHYKYSANVEFLEVTEEFKFNNSLNGYVTQMNYYPTYNNNTGTSEGYITAKSTTITFGFHNSNINGAIKTRWSNIQIEEVESLTSPKTSYEPYKSNILHTPEEVVLRSVENAQDTINLNTGEYVQRIGEVILNGSEPWQVLDNNTENTIGFALRNVLPLRKTGDKYVKVNCDKLPSYKENLWNKDKIGCVTENNINQDLNDTQLQVRVLKSTLSTQDTNGFKTWLQSNPVTVQYQLETPVITKINLPSTLKSWNTTTHIYSEIPENTLYPTLSHSNPTYPVILKPSTKYSIVANSYSNNHTNSTINFNLGGATASTTVGNRVTTITTPSTLSNELLTMSGRGNKLNNVMVIEGDVVGDEPYFEGICDSKSPILSNVGENLFTTNNMRTGNIAGNSSHIEGDDISGNWQVTDYIPVKPLIEYYHSTSLYKFEKASFYDINKKIIYGTGVNNFKTRVISTPHQCAYVRYVVMKDSSTNNSLSLEELVSNNDIVVTQGGSNIAYEPYKSNTTTFEQKDGKTIVLRSLPNGVCDTLNVETGEYVQRIGEVTKNNSTGFGLSGGGWENKSDVCTFEHFRPEGMKVQLAHDKPTLNCDKVPSNTFSTQWSNSKGIESITQHDGGGIVLSITRDKLLTQDTDGLNTYLQSNPLTIQYELATPIVSTIDVQGFPYAYENGHVQLSSGHNAQSLTPKVEYSVATNRNGQIRSNQKMVERHQKQLDQLQAIILANMVNTQYQQTLTTLNYDLLKKEVGE